MRTKEHMKKSYKKDCKNVKIRKTMKKYMYKCLKKMQQSILKTKNCEKRNIILEKTSKNVET